MISCEAGEQHQAIFCVIVEQGVQEKFRFLVVVVMIGEEHEDEVVREIDYGKILIQHTKENLMNVPNDQEMVHALAAD